MLHLTPSPVLEPRSCHDVGYKLPADTTRSNTRGACSLPVRETSAGSQSRNSQMQLSQGVLSEQFYAEINNKLRTQSSQLTSKYFGLHFVAGIRDVEAALLSV